MSKIKKCYSFVKSFERKIQEIKYEVVTILMCNLFVTVSREILHIFSHMDTSNQSWALGAMLKVTFEAITLKIQLFIMENKIPMTLNKKYNDVLAIGKENIQICAADNHYLATLDIQYLATQ